MRRIVWALALAGTVLAGPVMAQQPIKIGVTIAKTGPAASLGIPQANTVTLLPTEVAGQKIEWIVLDDASDTTKGVANARKLASDDKVDAIVGSSVTPVSLALIEVAAEAKVPMISLAASAKIVAPMDDKRRWVFKAPQNDALMAEAIAAHMAKAGVKSVGFIGFNDAYGDGWLSEITPRLEAKGIKLAATERYARTDTSVTGQVLKVIAAKPDAVLIAGSGTPAALPQKTLKERGYAGKYYQTHGVANADFLRVGGKDVDGTVLPAGPLLVAEQLPESNPVRKVALDYTKAYEAKFGAGSLATFGGHAYDAQVLLANAIPVALKTAKPGTPEFRAALRDALEGLKEVVYTHGVVAMTPTDHVGQDDRARVMVTIENGRWKLMPATN
ncbi:ABC transporter substrate-binding protein [Methylobacterium nonmethylotrophicum]|uniref:ABC transporter substrate-binding protein n=1 Tax=Methylobacterium nonmethylotrophicum TaxID=1141884 RepID=A0A4Z0NY55_9HYPH|nr:ABC transporter substrate-binding protein [Methylobacterium nonmethylotrophicum]TGE02637.1 ABC transporter substrate-binding protein [Methylobacterium nonmethylotrophicum]